MKIHTFNTGREYTEHGQRIAWGVLVREAISGASIVAFVDVDRHISEVVRVKGHRLPTDFDVLKQYDERAYLPTYIIPESVEDALQEAALKHGVAEPAPAQDEQQPPLTVWEGSMPESNGKSNFTAVLMRKGSDLFDGISGGMTIARSEYPDRVRYEADCVRWLIGEIKEEPCITDYDSDKHSGYAAPIAQPAPQPPCRECGGTSQTWFTQNVITTGAPQNRLNTNDVRCQFVLGCDECSETLKVVGADKVADWLNARSEVPSED